MHHKAPAAAPLCSIGPGRTAVITVTPILSKQNAQAKRSGQPIYQVGLRAVGSVHSIRRTELVMLGRDLCIGAVLLMGVTTMGTAQNFPAIDAQTSVAPPIVRPKKPIQQPPAQNFPSPGPNLPAIDPQTGAAPRIVPPKT